MSTLKNCPICGYAIVKLYNKSYKSEARFAVTCLCTNSIRRLGTAYADKEEAINKWNDCIDTEDLV